jgi:hypothetical protein
MALASVDVVQMAAECPVCGQDFLMSPPDGSHTAPYRKRPAREEDMIRARHECPRGRGSYVYWTNPPTAAMSKFSVCIWPYIVEW